MKILRGGVRKFLDTRKGGPEEIRAAPKICILQNQQERGGGGPCKIELLAGGRGC